MDANKNHISYSDHNLFKMTTEEINGKTEPEAHALLSSLDTTYLLSYALFMFLAGMVADRLDLRYFLSIGMVSKEIPYTSHTLRLKKPKYLSSSFIIGDLSSHRIGETVRTQLME